MKHPFKNRIPVRPGRDRKTGLYVLSGMISVAAFVLIQAVSPAEPAPYKNKMLEAARIMKHAVSVVGNYCRENNININPSIDPNGTGFIGAELTEITTTLGHLEAKRTTTNPDMAGLIVHLLYEAGVQPGDKIAVGSSASFPALLTAVLAAAEVMDVQPVVIVSLGASTYGATNMDLNILDIYELLINRGVFRTGPAAVSLGGDEDVGKEFDPETKEKLIGQIKESGVPFINESDLRKNVSARMKIYGGGDPGSDAAAFINIGGSWSNIGISPLVLKLKPGLNRNIRLPAEDQRGVLFEMAARDVPVIHLLYIKGLAQKYGVSWDPVPLPEPGKSALYQMKRRDNIRFGLIAGLYFCLLGLMGCYRKNVNK